ncbi:hypothetical protein [Sediminibacterium ginsengisoli]|uniref:HTH domain-containing protein n=1 Tax=Sediminibacterium ginsengisoli TaxID=413434 RepID=A0A1T4LVL3_9BACT|nr:hypothetical protein [Sediminibacterium ginsengisoli]SJZ58671.1 hypothetical protein SAMN04488132_10319 [Sediminibacterium ginsengisoli]
MGRKFVDKIKRIDYLIARKATGSPTSLARRMELSQTTLFEYLALLKDMGAPIAYDKVRQSYCYEEYGRFVIAFVRQEENALESMCEEPEGDSS